MSKWVYSDIQRSRLSSINTFIYLNVMSTDTLKKQETYFA